MLIMHKDFFQCLFVFLVFLLRMNSVPEFFSGVEGTILIRCVEKERQALLKFRQEVRDTSGTVLSSWGSEQENSSDCCTWRGVGCSNRTGYVTLLDLNGANHLPLRGRISDALLELQHLNYLDLSCNNFRNLPNSIGSLTNLRYLNLSYNSFTGNDLSFQIGNLSRLQTLDLSYNMEVNFESLEWLSDHLPLEDLYMSWTNLSQTKDWLQVVTQLPHLKYLQLSHCNLSHIVPPSISFMNFSKSLAVLDLSFNSLPSKTFNWLSNWLPYLSSLEHLSLSGNDLSQASDWLLVANKLPLLQHMRLSSCSLSSVIPPSLSLTNSSKSLVCVDLSNNNLTSSVFNFLSNFSSSLVDLDLSHNQLQGWVPDNFRNMSSLLNVDLSFNQLQGISRFFSHMCSLRALNLQQNNLIGPISRFFQNLYGCMENTLETLTLYGNQLHGSLPDVTRFHSMRVWDLSFNQLNGSLPKRFRQHSKLDSLFLTGNQLTGSLTDVSMLSSMRDLRIDGNRFDGNISESLGRLSNLEIVLAGGNSLQGMFSEAHFSNLSKLKVLDLSGNSLDFNIGSDWLPTFQLIDLQLASCNLGPHFPKWLRNQDSLTELDISWAGISGTIPNWFWSLSNSKLMSLNLSHNKMGGILPDLSSKSYLELEDIDLSFNQFEGPLPLFPSNSTATLFLSNNMFSGPVSLTCEVAGGVLSVLDLSNNLLSGQLPNCLMHLANVTVLNLANNNYSGEIPGSIGSLLHLETLSLHNNSFNGGLPLSLRNCSSLVFLDLSANKLQGEIPAWVGECLLSLKFLSLRSNQFYGSIPSDLCQLIDIRILDLSLNDFSGTIPKCLNNFTAMVQKIESPDEKAITSRGIYYNYKQGVFRIYFNRVEVGWRGREYEYQSTLGLLRVINFAGNRLIGKIPEEITGLLQLVAVNLSGNNLTGAIPHKIGQLKQLESLDLSGNQLSGKIPTSMAELNFLNYLNLSYNNLSGKIPAGTQLQTLNASMFAGNLALCGLPVTKKCPGDETPQTPPYEDVNRGNDQAVVDEFMKWFYIAMAIGFGVFFCGVSGALLLKRSWRHAYFRLLDKLWDQIYLIIAVQKARLQLQFHSLQEYLLG